MSSCHFRQLGLPDYFQDAVPAVSYITLFSRKIMSQITGEILEAVYLSISSYHVSKNSILINKNRREGSHVVLN